MIFEACSQTRELKSKIHVYNWKPLDSNTISLTVIKQGKINKIYDKNIRFENKYDSLNRVNYVAIDFGPQTQFSINNEYKLKINNLSFLIKDFKINSKSNGNDIIYTVNGRNNEIGDDDIINIDVNQ